jgi:hypothetical protein
MVPRTRALIATGAAAAVVALLGSVAWRLLGDREPPRSEPTVAPSAPTEPRRGETRPAPSPKLAPRPAETQETLPGSQSRPESRAESMPAEFTFEGKTAKELLDRFKDVPSYLDGRFRVESQDPFAFGLFNLYSYDPAQEELVLDRYVKGFHEKMVPSATDAGWRPKLDDWPRFSKWLRDAVSLYAALRRKELGCTYALLPEAPQKLTREERDTLEITERRIRDLRLEISRLIDREEQAFLGKPKDG